MKCSIYHLSGVMKTQAFADPDATYVTDLTGLSGTDLYCDPETESQILELLKKQKEQGTLAPLRFFDSGNYHYMSKLLASLESEPYTLICFDHHTDMQPSGLLPILSCGSWIVDLINTETPLCRVLSIGPPQQMTQEARELFVSGGFAAGSMKKETEAPANEKGQLPMVLFIREDELADGLEAYGTIRDTIRYKLRRCGIQGRIYVSIDKDVLSTKELNSNWDQGILSLLDVLEALEVIRETGQIIAIDVCGEPTADAPEEEIRKSEEINRRLYEFAVTI